MAIFSSLVLILVLIEKATCGGERRLYSRGVIFTPARVSLAVLSLRKNGRLLVVNWLVDCFQYVY